MADEINTPESAAEGLAAVATNLGEELADGEAPKEGWLAWGRRQFFQHLFPIFIMGVIGGGVTHVGAISDDTAHAHERVTENQYEADYDRAQIKADVAYKFQWAEGVVARNAAEMAALKSQVQHLEVLTGILLYRLDHLTGNTPGVAGGDAPEGAKPVDWEDVARRLEALMAKRQKVDPEELERYLEQRQAPVQAPNLPRVPNYARKGAPKK